eukprot:500939_1
MSPSLPSTPKCIPSFVACFLNRRAIAEHDLISENIERMMSCGCSNDIVSVNASIHCSTLPVYNVYAYYCCARSSYASFCLFLGFGTIWIETIVRI